MASNELERLVVNADSAIRLMNQALDIAQRSLPYGISHSLAAELAALGSGEVITANINKERATDLAVLAANLTFYLRGQASGGNTILGQSPQDAAGLKALVEATAI